MTDAERIAQFLAAKGATVVPAAVAYGVDAGADKAKRAEAAAQRRFEAVERESENYVQRIREERGYYGR